MSKTNKIVYIGLSGGVDSSVSAYLLKKAGYNVIGVFIRGWQPSWLPCTWKEDRISAMRTAAYLDIPFKTLDLEKEYKEKIVDYILNEYSSGRTPNGDMLCNREIKFGLFLQYAIQNGADFVATGHYAKNIKGELYEANNKEKDQSYFLSQINRKQLSKILFPLGNFKTKTEIRKIAIEAKLPVATRKESFGMCFVGDITMKEFLKNELKGNKNLKIGKVINKKGEEIGEHDGSILYTIGERHGFKIYKNFQTTENKKLYVIGKDLENNVLFVSENLEEKMLDNFPSSNNNILKLANLHLIFEDYVKHFQKEKELKIRVRYRDEKINVKVKEFNFENKTCELIILNENLKNTIPASGQFGVFYLGEKVLGGGVFI